MVQARLKSLPKVLTWSILWLFSTACLVFWFAPDLYGDLLKSLGLIHPNIPGNERNAAISLKIIANAQMDFRANDRDGDGVNQFWRADIAGLYTLVPGGGPAIKLIELSIAAADERPTSDLSAICVPSAHAGYRYRALRHADEQPLDPYRRHAACAFPADYLKSGRWTFIIDENHTVYRRNLGRPGGIDLYPTPEELEKLWSTFD